MHSFSVICIFHELFRDHLYAWILHCAMQILGRKRVNDPTLPLTPHIFTGGNSGTFLMTDSQSAPGLV